MITKEQSLLILAILKTAYPRFDDFKDPKKLAAVNDLWFQHFKEFDFDILQEAVHRYIDYGVYPPSIAEIRMEYKKLVDKFPTAEEAWNNLMDNIRNYGFYRLDEGVSNLDEISQKALDSIGGYCRLCLAETKELERLQEKYLEVYNDLKNEALENLMIANLQKIGGKNQNAILQSATE